MILKLERTIVCLFALACTGPAAATNARPIQPMLFEPAPSPGASLELSEQTWYGSGEDWAVELRQLDDDERLRFLASVTGLSTDPFRPRAQEPPGFISFLLHVENRGASTVHFNPFKCWLRTNKNKIQTPIGLTDLSFAFRTAGRDFPPAYLRLEDALLGTSHTLGPGESAAGLLVYRRLDPKTKSYTVELHLTLANGDVEHLAAGYRRQKNKR